MRSFFAATAAVLILAACAAEANITAPPKISPSLPKRWIVNGGTINLSYSVTDALPLGFQWYQNGTPIQDATNSDYLITNAQSSQTGLYTLTATNSAGLKASASVRLNVLTFPTVVAGWGDNIHGQISVPASLNDPSNGTNGAVAVACGQNTSCALKADGTVVAWGFVTVSNVPSGLTNVIQVESVGGFGAIQCYCLALKSDGTVASWGDGSPFGQTLAVSGLTNIVSITRSLALKSDGTVVTWDGTGNIQATGYHDVTAIASGEYSNEILTSDGVVSPQGYQNIAAVVAGSSSQHALAIKSDGSIIAWGYFLFGDPVVPPSGLPLIIGAAAGAANSLTLTADGTIEGWGGQYAVPLGITNAVDIAAGFDHSLAVIPGSVPRASGTLSGQFVNGKFRLTLPVLINQSFSLQVSADLTNWVPMISNAVFSVSRMTDNDSSIAPRRFYRIVPLP